MLFSDELLEIGRKSNPKSNMSMGQAALDIFNKLEKSSLPKANQECVMKYVFRTLDKEGFKYFGRVLTEAEAEAKSCKQLVK